MFSDPANLKEKIKNITIVVLLLTAILLLYFLWSEKEIGRIQLGSLFDQQEEPASIAAADIIVPGHVDISFGDGTYERSENDAFWYGRDAGEEYSSGNRAAGGEPDEEDTLVSGGVLSIKSAAVNVFEQSDILVEEITEEQYEEIMGYMSVRAVFEYDIPFADYVNSLGCETPLASRAIDSFREAGFSAAQADSLFIRDSERGKYFRIVSDYDSTELVLSCTDYCREYSSRSCIYLDEAIGTRTGARILVPLTVEGRPVEREMLPDFGNDDRDVIRDLARSFYGDSFDFVRIIEEKSGRTIFMYGYSEEILTFDNGTITYKSEGSGAGSGDFFASLDTALSGISRMNGFKLADGTDIEPILTGAEKISNGYRFKFNAKCGGAEIFYGEKNALIAEVSGGRLTYLYREFPVIGPAGDGFPGDMVPVSPVNVLTGSYKSIYSLLDGPLLGDAGNGGSQGPQEPSGSELPEDRFNYVCSCITDIRGGYYAAKSGEDAGRTIIPCWCVEVLSGKAELFYDYYTGELIAIKTAEE